ncbi:Uncharacterised protein [Mycobacteroides abscessus subsp. abscessus]|nr:Uncharacterised protein [Mycobacteroides abscessus subsp. abscessus]
MTDRVQAIGVFAGHDRQLGVAINAEARIDQARLAVIERDPAGQRGLGQTGADRRSHFAHGHRTGKLTLGTVGQRYLNHDKPRKRKR